MRITDGQKLLHNSHFAICLFLPASIVTGLEYPLNESEKERSALTSVFICTLTSMNSTLN